MEHEIHVEFLWEILTENGHFNKTNIRLICIKQAQKSVHITDFGHGVHNTEDLVCKELLTITHYETPVQ